MTQTNTETALGQGRAGCGCDAAPLERALAKFAEPGMGVIGAASLSTPQAQAPLGERPAGSSALRQPAPRLSWPAPRGRHFALDRRDFRRSSGRAPRVRSSWGILLRCRPAPSVAPNRRIRVLSTASARPETAARRLQEAPARQRQAALVIGRRPSSASSHLNKTFEDTDSVVSAAGARGLCATMSEGRRKVRRANDRLSCYVEKPVFTKAR